MVGAELVGPVAIADIGVPDSRLGPEDFRRVEREPNVLEDLSLGLVVVKRTSGTKAANREAVCQRNAGALRAAHVQDVDDTERIRPSAEEGQGYGVEDFEIPIPFEIAVAAERGAAGTDATAETSSRALGIAEAGRSASVELVVREFLAGQDADQHRSKGLRDFQVDVYANQVLCCLLREIVVLHAGGEAALEADVIGEDRVKRLAVGYFIEAYGTARKSEEFSRANGARLTQNWILLAVLVQFEVDQVRAVFPDVEVLDPALGPVERVFGSENAAGNDVAAAGNARIGRIEVPGEAHRSVVHEKERHGFRRRHRLHRHIRGLSIPARRHREQRGQRQRP